MRVFRGRMTIAVLMICVVAVMGLTVASCSSSSGSTTTSAATTSTEAAAATSTTEAAKVVKVGITVIVTHPVLALVEKSFKEHMTALGWVEGTNIEYETKNAEGDMASASAIAKQFADPPKDLVFGLGTPSIVAMAKESTTIPQVFAAMTDPVGAGVAKTLAKPGGNVTGVTDWVDPEKQFALILEAFPQTKKVGTILNLSEDSSKSWMAAATPAAKKLGLELITVPVAGTGDLQAAAQSLIGRVDVIFIPADNTTAAGFPVISKVAISNKIPVIAHSEQLAEQGALLALGLDYALQGSMAADLADQILKGANPGDLSVLANPELTVIVNTKTAEALGVEVPASIMSRATKVAK